MLFQMKNQLKKKKTVCKDPSTICSVYKTLSVYV